MQYSSVKKTKGETENQAYNVYNSALKKTPKRSVVLAKETIKMMQKELLWNSDKKEKFNEAWSRIELTKVSLSFRRHATLSQISWRLFP